ncbi:hypothetical protein CPB86DRAFT_782691 [Serendipita vermifera]|nr:hypothetical protein CPB86DRAFT_782691 [Serendipita vermifera]
MITITKHGESPPLYSEVQTPHLPPTFPVGKHDTAPVVTVEDLQAHLRILGAFAHLKQNVYEMNGSSQTGEDEAWVIYVNRAVHRFNSFMGAEWPNGFPGWREETTPPLDVLMVLHSYMLNPLTFYEDSVRRTTFFSRNLTAIQSYPFHLIASLIDPETLDAYPPSTERLEYFESIANEPFICPLATATSDILSLPCPSCDVKIHKIPWVTGEGTGFAQPSFKFRCSSCAMEFTKPMLGIRRFADEATRKRARRRVYFAETLLDPKTGKANDSLADIAVLRLTRRLNAVFSLGKPCENEKIGPEGRRLAAGLKWSPDALAEYLQVGILPKAKLKPDEIIPKVSRIVAAYSTHGPASIDLIGAVLRQSSFIAKMDEMRWSKPNQIPHDQEIINLVRAVARYHAFLDLMTQSAYNFFVPTLDIDLAWHTHQLTGPTYREDTLRLLGRTPDHDDTVEQTTLQGGYDETAKAWKARFGTPYTVCGCMMDPPPETKVEKGKTGIKKVFNLGRNSSDQGTKDLAVTRYGTDKAHPDLVPTQTDEIDSSHPSDHNLHRVPTEDGAIQVDRVARQMSSKERATKAVDGSFGSGLDEWQKLQAERKQTRTDHTEAFTGDGDGRYNAYWGVSANVPFGFWGARKYDNATGGCSTVPAGCSVYRSQGTSVLSGNWATAAGGGLSACGGGLGGG